jgi:hypothetical protein
LAASSPFSSVVEEEGEDSERREGRVRVEVEKMNMKKRGVIVPPGMSEDCLFLK